MNRYGVIDLGTNTFHLLIAEKAVDGQLTEVYRERIFVKLAEDGIEKIGTNAYQRGMDALLHYQKILAEKKVEKLRAFGTAALRTASNGTAFIAEAKEQTGIDIQMIAGSEEARLIHLGVVQAVQLEDAKGLIMDIGGGSVEFIIADKNQVFWAESFPIGVAVSHLEFHQTEPITPTEVQAYQNHLEHILQPLFQQLQLHPTAYLIGASGTFDVLEKILPAVAQNQLSTTIAVAHFYPLYQKIIAMNLEERLAIENIPPTRAEMLVVAFVLIDFILRKANIQKIMVSSYAMKEGILSEM